MLHASINKSVNRINFNLLHWVIYSVIIIYAFFLFAIVIAPFFQKDFFHPTLLIPIFLLIAFSEFIMSIFLWNFEKFKQNYESILILFILNSIVITTMLSFTGWHHSIVFILYLVNIVGCGIIIIGDGSFWIAVFSSIGFNLAVLVGPEFNGLETILYLALNNISFFLASSLTSFVSNEFLDIENKLNKITVDLNSLKNIHELVLKNIPSAVIAIDGTGKFHAFNDNLKDISNSHEFEEKLKHINFQNSESEFRIKNGNHKFNYFRVKKGELNIKNQTMQSFAQLYVIDDITEIKNIEWNMREQEKLAAVGKLAAGIAHEIRNPLASISGSVQLLSQQAHSDEDRKLFNIVIKETDRLNSLISDFLNYSRPLEKPTEKINLSKILMEVLDLLKFDKKLNSNVKLNFEINDNLYIYGYGDKLKQSFLNIIINAYHAMEKSAVLNLDIKLVSKSNGIEFSVKDTGSGMNDEVKRRLFEPFFTTKSRGTGLGLAVTHKIFEAHNASILVESEVGQGTLFVITFPNSVIV